MYDCDVLIAGGGPVGLCLGYLLARKGVAVRVLEAEAAIAKDLRASTFHPPTLDMLAEFGVAGEMMARGLVCPSWQVRLHPSGERAVFELKILADATAHPFRLQCEQWKLSEALETRLLREKSARLDYAARLESFEQDSSGVTARVARGDKVETLRARFLAGADGARGGIRKLLGLDFDGQTYPETTLLVTTTFPFEDHLDGLSNVSYCWKDGGNFSLLKVPGRWRVSLYPRDGQSVEDQLSEESVEASLQEIVPRKERYFVMEKRDYRVHQRIVPRYFKGRVALAGDAAHLNSPAGGMGLNGGIHDAFELAAALTAILGGADPEARLDLYDRRRRPVAKDQILEQADRNRARMRETDPARRRALLADLQAIAADPERARAYLLKSSMIDGLRMAAAIS
ncbi:MAG: FAD-dependent monooxygenase [Tagaea sp.]|nr:FAD-dependent monooxygenase [Tagaea sp.]